MINIQNVHKQSFVSDMNESSAFWNGDGVGQSSGGKKGTKRVFSNNQLLKFASPTLPRAADAWRSPRFFECNRFYFEFESNLLQFARWSIYNTVVFLLDEWMKVCCNYIKVNQKTIVLFNKKLHIFNYRLLKDKFWFCFIEITSLDMNKIEKFKWIFVF